MCFTDKQFIVAYEQENMTPEQIAQDTGFDITAVKAKLMQLSAKYRKDCGCEDPLEDDLNFSDQQLREINQVIYENAKYATLPDGSPDFRTRQRAAEYIRDDKKGRKEVVKAVQHTTFNLLNVNQSLQQARLQSQEAVKQITQRVAEPINV